MLHAHLATPHPPGCTPLACTPLSTLRPAPPPPAKVYALSRTADKEAEARGFGASGFVNTEDAAQLADLRGSFDMILLTASGRAPLDPYLELLKPRGEPPQQPRTPACSPTHPRLQPHAPSLQPHAPSLQPHALQASWSA